MCLGTNMCGHKRVWEQTSVGTNVCGLKLVWAQTCVGTNVSGHKRVWAQSCEGTNVSGHNRVGSSMYGHKRVLSIHLCQQQLINLVRVSLPANMILRASKMTRLPL